MFLKLSALRASCQVPVTESHKEGVRVDKIEGVNKKVCISLLCRQNTSDIKY
jgi:hypothetical protein